MFDDDVNKIEQARHFLSQINTESIARYVQHLHLNKACVSDNLSAEHLLYAHPSLIIHSKLLLSLMSIHGFLPDVVAVV
jgi:hypothetical protein